MCGRTVRCTYEPQRRMISHTYWCCLCFASLMQHPSSFRCLHFDFHKIALFIESESQRASLMSSNSEYICVFGVIFNSCSVFTVKRKSFGGFFFPLSSRLVWTRFALCIFLWFILRVAHERFDYTDRDPFDHSWKSLNIYIFFALKHHTTPHRFPVYWSKSTEFIRDKRN